MISEVKKRAGKKRTHDRIFFACLVTLPLVHFFIFYICVNFNSVLLAFKSYNSDSGYSWVGLQNFKNLFSDFGKFTLYKKALKNSMLVFLVGTTVSTVLALLFSYYIYKKASRGKNVFKVLLFMPSIISSIAMATMFKQFADSAIPKLVQTVFHKEVQGLLQNPDTTMGAVIFYNVWIGFGVNILLYLGAMNNISESVVEAAKLDGVTFVSEFFKITLPLVFGTVQTLLVVAIGGIFINQASLVSFFGTTSEEEFFTIGYWLYKETVKTTLNNSNAGLPQLSAFGLLLTFVTVPVVYLFNFITKKFGPSVG